LGDIKSLAKVKVNGRDLGVVWKPSFNVELTDVVKDGPNTIEIAVSNAWYNRLVKDASLPVNGRKTWIANGCIMDNWPCCLLNCSLPSR
jgi:hypothetical protein